MKGREDRRREGERVGEEGGERGERGERVQGEEGGENGERQGGRQGAYSIVCSAKFFALI